MKPDDDNNPFQPGTGIANSRRRGGFSGLGKSSSSLSSRSLNLRSLRSVVLNLVAATIAGTLAIVVVEAALRIAYPKSENHYVLLPNQSVTFTPRRENVPGVSVETMYQTSSAGIRGPEFSDDDEYRILAIGGSTTQNVYLDQSETWTLLLGAHLNAIEGSPNTWTGDVGRSGVHAERRAHLGGLDTELVEGRRGVDPRGCAVDIADDMDTAELVAPHAMALMPFVRLEDPGPVDEEPVDGTTDCGRSAAGRARVPWLGAVLLLGSLLGLRRSRSGMRTAKQPRGHGG